MVLSAKRWGAEKTMNDRNRHCISLLFFLYLAVLFRITVFRSGFGTRPLFTGAISASLFTDYIAMLAAHKWGSFLYLFFGNIAWFIPFGFFLRRHFHRPLPQAFLFGFLLSLCIETLQFVFAAGLSEPDDLILNSSGALLGWLLGRKNCREKGTASFLRFRRR